MAAREGTHGFELGLRRVRLDVIDELRFVRLHLNLPVLIDMLLDVFLKIERNQDDVTQTKWRPNGPMS